MGTKRVGVLMGGASAEREISLRSGRAVVAALEHAGHDVVALDLSDLSTAFQDIRAAGIAAAFLTLHGRFGEDGCVQGMLELLRIPYTGSSVMASALAMDKLKSKELFRLYNVPTPPYYVYDSKAGTNLAEAHGSFGFPVIVKPRREGSSIGITRVNSLDKLASAIEVAQKYDRHVLVERFITGTEVAVAILDGRVLGAIEIVPKSGVYDFAAKYTPGMTDYFMPARLPSTRYRGVLNLAARAAAALDISGAARVDVLVTPGQNEYVLEVNTLPGMTPTSLMPKIAEAAGYGFSDLCEAILRGATLHAAQNEVAPQVEQPAASSAEAAEPLRVAV